jgi:hypothetical protein
MQGVALSKSIIIYTIETFLKHIYIYIYKEIRFSKKLCPKKRLKVKSRIEWPMMEMCDTVFKRSFQGLQVYNWKLFNWSSCEKVMNLQSCEIHNLQISRPHTWDFWEKDSFQCSPHKEV